MNYAPIALFTYNRADHTRKALESLLQNAEAKDSDLFIFSDGPKNEKASVGVAENRKYIHTISGFKTVTIIEREKNWGLANSLIAGITEVINKYGKIIVVEDDLVLSPYFLRFMNDGLEKYKDEHRIGAISGFVYPVNGSLPNTFFLRYFNCWGWAIWKRSWDLLNLDTKYLLRKMRFKVTAFNYGGNGAYGNLYCQKLGLVDSWWVRLYASLFLTEKLILHPGVSLTANEGSDGSGTHVGSTSEDGYSKVEIARSNIILCDIPIEETEEAKYAYINYFSLLNRTSLIKNWLQILKSFIRRLLYIDCM